MNISLDEVTSFREAQEDSAVKECKPRANSSFRQFVLAHEAAVFTYCFRMLGDAERADMAAQTAFLDIYPHFPAVSLVIVLAAAHRRYQELLGDGGPVRETAVDNVQHLFKHLPVPEREVVALWYGCRLSLTEIAVVLETSCAVVRLRLQQGRWHAAGLEQSRSSGQGDPFC